jgi:NTE family protein
MPDERIALVLAGGGARGAYEAGALTVLLPELERRGQRPDIVVGTSVGALNAAFVAATAHRPAADVAEDALAIWSQIRYRDVLAPLASAGTLARAAGYLGEALGIPHAHAWSVLDPSPLRRTLPSLVDLGRIRSNLASGRLRTAALVATSARTLRSVVFHEGEGPADARDDKRGIDYVPARLGLEHVLASAAIPALFPAVAIDGEWFSDGGTRLNTPIKPALAMGATRVVAVALNAVTPADFAGRPDALVGAASILQSLLADQLVHDMRTLTMVNELVDAAGAELAGRRSVPHILVTPRRPDIVGALARDIFREHYADLFDALKARDMATLGRAVGGGLDAAHGELLSYLFFAPEFTQALLRLGRADAERWVASAHDDGLWSVVA